MDKKSNKWILLTSLSVLVIVLVTVTAILLRKKHIEEPVPTKEIIQLKKEETVKLPKTVLRSSLAGTWYSADPESLNKQLDSFFQKAGPKTIENVVALILPHAGYRWSGQTAAYGLKTIKKQYKRIVVIGPSHQLAMEDMLSVPRVTHYETPLGQIPLDVEFINKLLKHSLFQNVPQVHKYEHSVQIEVPILQHYQKDFKLVPIVAGSCSLETINKAGIILRSLVDQETLVIASSDFVHYGTGHGYVPFTENIPEQIKKIDMGAYEYIARLDNKGLLDYRKRTGATICGYIPIAILLSMLGQDSKAELIEYATSGELTGDYSNSVSYLSIVFSGVWQKHPELILQENSRELTEEDKKQLLTLARNTIVYALRNRRVPQVSDLGITITDSMRYPRAAFVTLKKHSLLRGCIGDIFPQRPLYRAVIVNAINACFNDRRFQPITEDECGDITIEISALTTPEPVSSAEQIRIGTDGVVLSKDGHSAVYLPQVAPQQGWDINQMLTQLSLKAQLPADAWKEGASFLVFQADVFGESEKATLAGN
ncbi:MAG: AmmeMemoRadiSam system protein B [Planctomycetota bacterium]|jgi:AmmeMemoRadiSam system protein B/AmmeMemoRadiSam system protein A